MYDINYGIVLFNDSDFFAAHDFFEDIWFECKRSEKLFFQGMVQISVGCYHLICGNVSGAKSQLQKGLEKLKNYPNGYYQIDLKSLMTKLSELSMEADELSGSAENLMKKIPTIELIN